MFFFCGGGESLGTWRLCVKWWLGMIVATSANQTWMDIFALVYIFFLFPIKLFLYNTIGTWFGGISWLELNWN